MTTSNTRAMSDLAIPPGELLEEELEVRGIAWDELVVKLGITIEDFEALVQGKRSLTEAIAVGLEGVLPGISKEFWLGLEENYRETLKRNEARERL